MLLVVLTVSGVLFVKGSAASVRTQKVCYGKSWNIPSEYLNLMRDELIYLTPSNGGARKVVMKKGKAVDPRFKVSPSSINFTDVTKQDEGLFSVVFNPSREFELVKLKVLDCAEEVTRDYGSMWNYPDPTQAEFLEFTPEGSSVLKSLIIALTVGMGIFCCCYCCVKPCFEEDKSDPQTAAADQTAPAVHSHNENQPTCPSYRDAPPPFHPENSHVSEEPTATFIAPPENHGVNIHENPSQPEVALPSSQGSTLAPSVDLDFPSSEPVPQFELKGLTFPSAPPLSSDPVWSNVYYSEKLNFL